MTTQSVKLFSVLMIFGMFLLEPGLILGQDFPSLPPPPPPPAANQSPSVSISSPANGSSFLAGSSVNLTATAVDADGSISKVEFFQNGSLIEADSAAPYGVSWNISQAGTYSITAKAIDNAGAVTTSAPITVIISLPPSGNGTSQTVPRITDGNTTMPVTIGSNAFDLVTAGDYILSGLIRAPSDGANSFFVDVDTNPAGTDRKIWDLEISSVFLLYSLKKSRKALLCLIKFQLATFCKSADCKILFLVTFLLAKIFLSVFSTSSSGLV